MSRYQFVNPYNFIPIAPGRAKAQEGEKCYTGVIEYSVLTKTPLFIPNTSNSDVYQMDQKVKDHKSYDFFTYTDLSGQSGPTKDSMPVIPGSEMRGMIRSNYEILTNSCLSAVDDDVTLSKRTNEVFQAGLIHREGEEKFALYEAEDCLMRTKGENSLEDDWKQDPEHYARKCYIQEDIPEGKRVYFQKIDRENKVKPLALQVSVSKCHDDDKEGYLIKGESGPEMKERDKKTTSNKQKHCCHVFALKNNKDRGGLVIKDVSLKTLEKVLTEYENNEEHPYREYREQFNRFKNGKAKETYFPVYYSYIKDIEPKCLMLSPACITREIYSTKIKDMIPNHRPCEDKAKLCPACALFGTVKTSGDVFAVSSRIRFSDLSCQAKSAEECYMEKMTLPPLSSPKLNNMEFYLQRPSKDAVFWTYDYYFDQSRNIHPNQGTINGRKFFWHNLDSEPEPYEPSNQNITIRRVKKGILFKGKLYFQNVTKTELDQLIFVMNGGDEAALADKKHGYKLGGGKPLGLGSIAISVDGVKLRRIIKNEKVGRVERQEMFYSEYAEPEFDKTILDNFYRMTDFDAVKGKNVSYPYTDKRDEHNKKVIFDWFVKNHVKRGKDGSYPCKGMPNARRDMAYAEYLEAMNPLLQSTKNNGKEPQIRVSAGGVNKAENVQKNVSFDNMTIYKAEVTGYNKDNTLLYIRVEGILGSIYFKYIPGARRGRVNEQLIPLKQRIRVKFLNMTKKGDKTYYNFRMIDTNA